MYIKKNYLQYYKQFFIQKFFYEKQRIIYYINDNLNLNNSCYDKKKFGVEKFFVIKRIIEHINDNLNLNDSQKNYIEHFEQC